MSEPHHDTPSWQQAVEAGLTAPGKGILITFPPSLDCELSRFLLAYYCIPYEERRHTIIFSFFATLWHGSTLHFPLLYGGPYGPLDTVRKMIH